MLLVSKDALNNLKVRVKTLTLIEKSCSFELSVHQRILIFFLVPFRFPQKYYATKCFKYDKDKKKVS